MTPERWQQVKSTLAGALDCDDTRSRTEFLRRACGEDRDLRAEVDSLLDQPPDEFETVLQTIGLVHPESLGPSKPGLRLGAYELLRELGRGGMGAVWLARRADQQFEKLVAIKLLKRGTDTDEVLRRFHAERQILARLDHPNIARLLDAGTTDDGLPYFVMEYVDGERLTDFAREKKLSLGERLRLFLKICHAVQFAHQNLVIHRDLKPGNILVNAEGEPKLLDFGVAKLLAPGDDLWQQTIAGQERFTPGYASPEQIRGEAITTVSDVYSLGALLYELLTDAPPHRFLTTTPTATQVARVVCEEEPARPSAAAADPERRRLLRGDLDTILLRALAKTPERRYRGAGNLADDLRRYLENRPVHARPDTFGYRAGKFLRRNRAGTAAVALMLLLLVAGVVATAREAQIANRERARAERRFSEVRKIANSFMFELHSSIANLPGALAARQLVTQRAVEYLDSLAQEAGDDLALKSELATAYNNLGSLTFGLRESIAIHEKATVLAEALVQAAPENTDYRVQLSESCNDLSDAMKISGHSRRAIEYAQKSVALIAPLAADHPEKENFQDALADREIGLAITLADAGDFRSALQNAQAALPIRERLAATHPSDTTLRRELGANYSSISDAYADAGDTAQAIEYAIKERAAAQENFAADATNSGHQRDMWATHFRVGRHLATSGDGAGALEEYRRAIPIMETLAAADPRDAGHRRWLALTYSAIGDAQAALGEKREALMFQEKALAISENLATQDPERVEAERDVAKICRSLGSFYLSGDETERAAVFFDRAIAILERSLREDPENGRVISALAAAETGRADCLRKFADKADSSPDRTSDNLRRAADQASARSRELWQQLRQRGMLTTSDAAWAAQHQARVGR